MNLFVRAVALFISFQSLATAVEKAPPPPFRFALAKKPASLEPARATSREELLVVNMLYEGLITLMPDTLEPVGGVAQSWTVSSDRLTYIFFLREDARWRNGRKVIADDFINAWEQVVSNAEAYSHAHWLLNTVNNSNLLFRRLTEQPKKVFVDAKATSESTLRVTFAKPFAVDDVLKLLSMPIFFPMAPIDAQALQSGEAADRPVGNGPFRLEENDGKNLRFSKNPAYWGERQVQIERIDAVVEENPQEVYYQYTQGDLDWTGTVDISAVAEPALRKRRDLNKATFPDYFYLEATGGVGPAVRPGFRRALSMAINRKLIQQFVLSTGKRSESSFVQKFNGKNELKYPGKFVLAYDLQRARTELRNLGVCIKGETNAGECLAMPEIILASGPSADEKKIALALRDSWRQGLGMQGVEMADAPVVTGGGGRLLVTLKRGFFVFPSTWASLQRWVPVASEQYGVLLNGAIEQRDLKTQAHLLAQAETLLVSDLPAIPLVDAVHWSLRRPEVQGFYHNLLDIHPLKYIYFSSTTPR